MADRLGAVREAAYAALDGGGWLERDALERAARDHGRPGLDVDGGACADVAGAVLDVAAELERRRLEDWQESIAATFPSVATYVSVALGVSVEVDWSDTADTDPADVLGVRAVTIDGDAFAWADAAAHDWPDVLADRLRADLAGEVGQ